MFRACLAVPVVVEVGAAEDLPVAVVVDSTVVGMAVADLIAAILRVVVMEEEVIVVEATEVEVVEVVEDMPRTKSLCVQERVRSRCDAECRPVEWNMKPSVFLLSGREHGRGTEKACTCITCRMIRLLDRIQYAY